MLMKQIGGDKTQRDPGTAGPVAGRGLAGRGGMDKANPSIAAEFYRQAKDGGVREAEDELKGLCTLLAQPSADIDERVRVSTTEQYCR